MTPFIVIYGIVAVLMIVVSLIGYMREGRENTRKGARIILVAPVWPLLAPVFLFRAIRWLWKMADWKGVEGEESYIREQRRGNRDW